MSAAHQPYSYGKDCEPAFCARPVAPMPVDDAGCSSSQGFIL